MFSDSTPDLQSLQALLETARIGWWKADLTSGAVLLGENIAERLGLPAATTLEALLLRVRADYAERIRTRVRRLETDRHFDETFPVVLDDNTELWYHVQLVGRLSDPQRGIRLFGSAQHVAARDSQEADRLSADSAYHALLRQARHRERVLTHLPIGYIRLRLLYDAEGRAVDFLFQSINRTARTLLGLSADHLGRSGRELRLEHLDRYLDTLSSIRMGSHTTGEWHVRSTGRHLRHFLYNTPDDTTELVLLLLDQTDTTELRRTQDRLREFETMFRMVSDYARVGYASYNLLTLEGYAQEVWLRNYGESPAASIHEVVRRFDHLHPDDRAEMERTLELLRTGRLRSRSLSCRILGDDGTERWISTHLLCRDYRPDEGIVELQTINYDITRLKQTERELVAAKERAEEANTLKSAFLANMSHEIRTPLNAIVGFSELLAEEEDPDARREYGEIILRNNDLLLQLISDVLDLARIESGRAEIRLAPFDAAACCRETVESLSLQAREGVVLRTAEPLDELQMVSYRQGLLQVLGNYVRNALKFTRQGSVDVGFDRLGPRVRFWVRDTGIGIDAAHLAHVFERFYKVDTFTQGTGLGLSICRSVAEQLGGCVGAESTPGEGSLFWIELPLHEESPAAHRFPEN